MTQTAYENMVESLASIKGITRGEAAAIIIEAVQSFEEVKKRRNN